MDESQKIDKLILLIIIKIAALENERELRLAEASESLGKSRCNKCKAKASPCLHYDPSDDEE